VNLHPALRHLFRFWIWMTSGMGTREWVAVHRKHHAFCERDGDPHSPRVFGLKRVLLEGSELYRVEAVNPQTLEKYGRGTPQDWLERNIYERYTYGGIALLVLADLVLFGVPGIIIIAVQLSTMPIFAAGVINGLGHALGYRNFETEDASTNLVPWGLVIGGEELHNNHHAFPTSAKFSVRPWEFDIGWAVLRLLALFRLAEIRRVAPRLTWRDQPIPDVETVRALLVTRMHVLRDYSRQVTGPILQRELKQLGDTKLISQARRWLRQSPALLDDTAQSRLAELLERCPRLATVMQFRSELRALWEGANRSNDRLVAELKEWCARAEASGIHALQEFAQRVRGYQLAENPLT
jgi:stearoyl-CoA desaturase (delta-9 desaturase)